MPSITAYQNGYRAQLYVKGGDYDIESLEETKWVRSWGGEARALAFVDTQVPLLFAVIS